MGKPKPLISSILHPCHHRDSVTEIHCHREATNLKDSQSKQQPSANPGCRKGKRSIVASVDSMHILEINSTMRKSKSGGGKEEVLKEVGNANKKKSPQCWHPKEEEVGGGEAHMGVHCPHTETPVVGETGATCFFAPSPAHPPTSLPSLSRPVPWPTRTERPLFSSRSANGSPGRTFTSDRGGERLSAVATVANAPLLMSSECIVRCQRNAPMLINASQAKQSKQVSHCRKGRKYFG